jgi:superfamily I DNA/RNA helicase
LPILFHNLSAGRPVFFKDRAFLQDVLLTRVELENNGEESLREDIRKEKVKTARRKLEILLESAQIASQELLKAGLASKNGPFLGTIHSAKGLEWDTVFLLDWEWQHPDYSPREAAEESNLRYVGITRARNNLFFIDKGDTND